MTDIATRTAAPLVLNVSRKLGVEIPKALAEALDEAATLRTREVIPATPSVPEAVAQAVLAGRDPLTSKEVQRAALALTLSQLNLEHRLREYADERAAAALREHADAVIDTWRPTVERIDQAFANFRALVPGVDPLAEHLPTGLPTKALTPWGEAKEAAALLEQIVKGWQAIASVGTANIRESRHRLLIVADCTPEQMTELGTRAKPQDVARFDLPLDLASVQTFAERVKRMDQALEASHEYAAAAPERAREERRRQFGMVMIP